MINKAILGPLFAAIALFVKQVFGYEIPVEWQDGVMNVILFAIMVAGILMHPKKKEEVKPVDEFRAPIDPSA